MADVVASCESPRWGVPFSWKELAMLEPRITEHEGRVHYSLADVVAILKPLEFTVSRMLASAPPGETVTLAGRPWVTAAGLEDIIMSGGVSTTLVRRRMKAALKEHVAGKKLEQRQKRTQELHPPRYFELKAELAEVRLQEARIMAELAALRIPR